MAAKIQNLLSAKMPGWQLKKGWPVQLFAYGIIIIN